MSHFVCALTQRPAQSSTQATNLTIAGYRATTSVSSHAANLSSTCEAVLGVIFLSCLALLALTASLRAGFFLVSRSFATRARAALSSAALPRSEVLTQATALVAASVLFAAAAGSSDDSLDSALMVILAVVVLTLALAAASLSVLFLYALSSASSGESLRKAALADMANVVLCLVRIVLCWTRYIFYDIQVEAVDFALHYTDEICCQRSIPQAALALAAAADIAIFVLQLTLSLFKLLIAAFLAWLIIDLFVLRPVSASVSAWSRA